MQLSKLFEDCLNVKYRSIRDVNYAYERRGGLLRIFFEDSNGRADWCKNLDFPQKAYKRMGKTVWRAHRGFLGAWREVEGIFEPIISDKGVKSIIIAGYSHGGALAVLCHEYAWYKREDLRGNIHGYGFGAPRVFWGRLKCRERWQDFRVIRNINDIVTRLPPWIFGYRHVGKLLRVGKKGKYRPIEAHFPQNIMKELKAYDILHNASCGNIVTPSNV